jgi:hypothetical protein
MHVNSVHVPIPLVEQSLHLTNIETSLTTSLRGQSHENVYKFLTWDGSFSLN